jgi:hypothetical protein
MRIFAAPRCHRPRAPSGANAVFDHPTTARSSPQLRPFMLGDVVSLAAVGYVRASEILMGPSIVVLTGTSQVLAVSTRILRMIVTTPGPSHVS